MILRKPYAFFIKYFRWFHVAIAILSAFLIYKSFELTSFFSDYNKNSQLIANGFEVGDYLNIWIFLIAFLVIVLNIFLLSVMIVKKKPFIQYVYNLIVYFGTMIVFGFDFSILRTVAYQVTDVTTTSLLRDFSMIVMFLQIGTFITAVIRSTGFDIKKFDFGEDLEKLEIDIEDNEEFEVDVEFSGNKIVRRIKRILRYAKYVIIENKFFVTISAIIIALFIGLMIYFNVGIYSMHTKENSAFGASGVVLNVKNSYITTKDYQLKDLNDDKALVIVRVDIKASGKKTKTFNTGLATLNIKNYSFGTTTKYISSILDLGKIYFNQTLESDYNSYLLVYEIPKSLKNDKMTFKFNDTSSYVRGQTGAKNIYVKLKPVDLDKSKENKEQTLGSTLNLKDSILGQTTLKISSYEIAERFKITYNYCYTSDKCVSSAEYVNPTATTGYNKAIMKLEGTFKKDSTINVEKMSNLYDFIYSFGTLNYVVDGKSYSHPTKLERVVPGKTSQKDVYYIEVVDDLLKADNIYFTFKVRNQEYKYILK